MKDRLAQLPELHLDAGGHFSFEDGFCATELAPRRNSGDVDRSRGKTSSQPD